MKKYKVGDRFILPKKCKLLEVTEWEWSTNCCHCYYIYKKKCTKAGCSSTQRGEKKSIYFKDISKTLSESDQILLERGLLIL